MCRFTVLTMVSCMLFGLASCGSDDDDTENIVKIEGNNNVDNGTAGDSNNDADNGIEGGNNNNIGTISGTVNGHDYVDLGLPSGLMWATCNIGASSPSDYGDYFAWGETTTKTEYSKNNSITYGREFGDISGTEYDVARANWSGSWRMPSEMEFEELMSKCTWTWMTQDGNNGYKVTGPNGNSIFLPAAGYRDGSSLYDTGGYGEYWSSTPYENNTHSAYYFGFFSGLYSVGWYYRGSGLTVRPVLEIDNNNNIGTISGTINGHDYVDLGLSSGLKWATCNVGASSPSDYGNYYAWGETTTKTEYWESNSVTVGRVLGDISGNLQYDAARANWGGSWRMPSPTECDELNEKCTWIWTTQDGHNGYKVTGPNGNSIFLPAAGFRVGASLYYAGSGYCWSSTPYESNAHLAYSLGFGSGSHGVDWCYRNYGLTVRPVSE